MVSDEQCTKLTLRALQGRVMGMSQTELKGHRGRACVELGLRSRWNSHCLPTAFGQEDACSSERLRLGLCVWVRPISTGYSPRQPSTFYRAHHHSSSQVCKPGRCTGAAGQQEAASLGHQAQGALGQKATTGTRVFAGLILDVPLPIQFSG